jgi:glycine dehydrogenase subunit 1
MFTPHTTEEIASMLDAIGVEHLEALFDDIPEEIKSPPLNLPNPLTEMEVADHLAEIASANESAKDLLCFLGAGYYNHYVPAIVDNVLSNGSFYSAYTPYQPEISQGTLQAVYEYQSLICALTGMEASNASHYDGGTAAAEAVILAFYHFRQKRSKIILSKLINPQYAEIIHTYASDLPGIKLSTVPEVSELADQVDLDTALVVVQYPDFLGIINDYAHLVKVAHENGALVCVITNPTALALLSPPGEWGADIVVGEGQPLGIPMSYGGPGLGFFATNKNLIRKIAGRIAGETSDANGTRGYVLTLTAREQHIRRERATSNICTNQGLLALAATVYLSALGKTGFKQVSNLCYQHAHYAAHQIDQIDGYALFNAKPFFHEFVVSCPEPVAELNEHLLDHGIIGGLDLTDFLPEIKNPMLLAFTELTDRSQIDFLISVLREKHHEHA